MIPETNDWKAALECKVALESCHIYTDELPSVKHEVQAQKGADLAAFLEHLGMQVEKWLLIDDYNPGFGKNPLCLDESAYLEHIRMLGFVPKMVVRESSLVAAAEMTLDKLTAGKLTHKGHDGDIRLDKGGVLLYHSDEKKYSCALLDACLYVQKLQTADFCLTILEECYAGQQKNVKSILKVLGYDPSIVRPYFIGEKDGQMSKAGEMMHHLLLAYPLFEQQTEPLRTVPASGAEEIPLISACGK